MVVWVDTTWQTGITLPSMCFVTVCNDMLMCPISSCLRLDPPPPYRLPIGIAGLLAAFSGIAGAVVGMSQVWYTGPIGKMVGATHGADLGFEVRIQRIPECSARITDVWCFDIACSWVCCGDVSTSAMDGNSADGEMKPV